MTMHPNPYTLTTTDGAARLGALMTAHGSVPTPTFMAVGTHGAVRACLPSEVKATGVDIVLANTYHIACRPGVEHIEEVGGLHEFMQWNGPILTDSGGYQALSLSHLSRISDEGIVFVSPYDGSQLYLSPEDAVHLQERYGSDIIMCLDHPALFGSPDATILETMHRTHAWAERSIAAHTTGSGLLFGIVQGGYEVSTRRLSAQTLASLPFDGLAIGGLSVGEPHELMIELTREVTDTIPSHTVRYFMGLGSDRELLALIAQGVDMFDCVAPTRLARHGVAYTPYGPLTLKKAQYREDHAPLVEGCPCPACMTFSRSYLRHLFNVQDILAHRLVSLHNLTHLACLMKDVRAAIGEHRFDAFHVERLAMLNDSITAKIEEASHA
ncbi:MAG: tRNA guanosine(34) transglycosylase Tgt [Candidatus Dormibacteria bacterium]